MGGTPKPIDEVYLEWLYDKVCDRPRRPRPHQTYWKLFRILYSREFVWFIPNDDNRVGDGVELRGLFLRETQIDVDSIWMDLGCSMLEMLVALADRLEFCWDEKSQREWFWELIRNLDIDYTDARAVDFPEPEIQEVIDRVIWRTYNADGSGGLFPLNNPRKDQTKIELWYQMNSYVIERF